MLLGEEVNDLAAFRTVNFTESYQNIGRILHAKGNILALKNPLKYSTNTLVLYKGYMTNLKQKKHAETFKPSLQEDTINEA